MDTAAVLLLDPSAQYLVATAARGIEEEVRQGVRIPLGKGFAGRIAAQKRAVFLERVDHTNVLNPILRDKGIHSLLGVPLLVGGAVLGVLHVGTLTPRQFSADDTDLLQLVADRIALAVHARTSQVERAAASALQRSLLPTALPEIAGFEFAARYVPGDQGQVGGDWYDVFALPSGALCIVVGDVVGRGLSAAVEMGRLRHALRAYTLDTADPAELLRRLDRHVRQFEPDVMATVLCAVVEPSGEQMRLSTAGHPPPVISAGADLPAALLELPADLPIGVDPACRRHVSTVALPPGTAVCLYTDGLVERRGHSLTVGLDRLAEAMFAGPAESVCAAVMQALVGADPPSDDIALLVLHRQPVSDAGNAGAAAAGLAHLAQTSAHRDAPLAGPHPRRPASHRRPARLGRRGVCQRHRTRLRPRRRHRLGPPGAPGPRRDRRDRRHRSLAFTPRQLPRPWHHPHARPQRRGRDRTH